MKIQTREGEKKGHVEVFSKCPFTPLQENIIRFKTVEEQEKFFKESKLLKKEYDSDTFGYIDKEGYIDIDMNISKAENMKYLRFKNSEKGQYYYGFILKTQMITIVTTRFYFELDEINTSHFKIFNPNLKFNAFQCHFKRYNKIKIKDKDGKEKEKIIPFISESPQGFNLGERRLLTYDSVNPVEWLIVVAKPSIKLNSNDDKTNLYGSIVGSYKAFRYFVVPINMESGFTRDFQYDGKDYKPQNIMSYMKEITNTFGKGKDTVNQIVNVYTTLHCGLNYKIEDKTIKILNKGLQVIGIGKGRVEGGGSGSGGGDTGSGGNQGVSKGDIPKDTHELAHTKLNTIFENINEEKMYQKVVTLPRVKYHGLTLKDCKKISDIVDKEGFSHHIFWAYEINEGLGINKNTGLPWGWLNHTVQKGNAFEDAKAVGKWGYTDSRRPNPLQLAWADSYNSPWTPPQDVMKKGNEDANSTPQGSFGRLYLIATSASCWGMYYPQGLKGSVNGVQDYANPWENMLYSLRSWQK